MKGKKTSAEIRITITKKFLNGSSVRELAGIYNISESTVTGYLRTHIDHKGRVISKPPAIPKDLQLRGEVWKPVPIHCAYRIEASSLGRIKSHALGKERIIGGNIKWGYRSITYVLKNGTRKEELVHILIAKAWHGTRPSHKHVCVHVDYDKWNNEPSNLRWMLRKDAQRHSRHSPYMDLLKNRIQGMPVDKSRSARYGKLSRKDATTIKQKVHNGRRTIDIAKEYGIAEMTVSRIHRGLIWSDVLPQLTRKKIELKIVPVATRIAIIAALRAGMMGKDVAKLYGFDPTTISRIKKSLNHTT